MTQDKKKREFSKTLLIQESILIWIMTLGFMFLALICILRDYTGSLPWLTAMITLPWTAYGVSQAMYYKKSTIENSKNGIKYDTIMASISQEYNYSTTSIDYSDIDLDYGV